MQQLIEGNVSPYLPGIRVHRVRLSKIPDKVVFVIQVPQGNTAYQAKDGRYYGRSEFEAKFLPDHEVRLQMSRGKTANGLVILRVLNVELGADKEASVRSRYQDQYEHLQRTDPDAIRQYMLDESLELANAKMAPDKITFAFAFRNNGEITVRDPVIELQDTHSQALFDEHRVHAQALPLRVVLKDGPIYPSDEQPMEGSERWVQCRREVSFAARDYVVRWKVYLDNSPPNSGEIDLGLAIDAAREGAASTRHSAHEREHGDE